MPTFPPPGDGYRLQAQRTAMRIEPGFLPGSAGFDGTDGADFGESAEDLHDTTTILFQAVFRGAIEGQVIAGTPGDSVPDREVVQIEYTRSPGAPIAITPPLLEAFFVTRASSLAITNTPLQGTRYNWREGSTSPAGITGFTGVTLKTDNATGTPTEAYISPRHREILYQRFWTAPAPDGTLLAMAVSATGRVVRAYLNASNNLLLEFWVRTAWEPHTTGLTITGNGAMVYDTASAASRLYLLYEDSGAIKGRYTDDEGSTWSVATTIAATGTYPAICISPTQARHHFWYDGGAIKTLITDSLGTTTTSATTVVASGVASSPIDAVHDGKLLLLTYKTSGGAVVTVVSTDGGLTFS